MLDNYPPNFDPKLLEDDPYSKLAEQIHDQTEVHYKLIVSVGDDEVYASEFHSEESLQEDGLRKAEHAINEWFIKETDRQFDELTAAEND